MNASTFQNHLVVWLTQIPMDTLKGEIFIIVNLRRR